MSVGRLAGAVPSVQVRAVVQKNPRGVRAPPPGGHVQGRLGHGAEPLPDVRTLGQPAFQYLGSVGTVAHVDEFVQVHVPSDYK
jgi:hypothetical protein